VDLSGTGGAPLLAAGGLVMAGWLGPAPRAGWDAARIMQVGGLWACSGGGGGGGGFGKGDGFGLNQLASVLCSNESGITLHLPPTPSTNNKPTG